LLSDYEEMMRIYKYVLLAILIIQSAPLCHGSDVIEEKKLLQKRWISSANITFGDKVATDIDKKRRLDSNQLLEWHMSQAPELANVYNNYQNTGRMVGKYLVSVVYEKEDNSLEIAHKFFSSVFISGWDVKDTVIELKPKKDRHLHFKNEESPKQTDINSFVSLRNIIKPGDLAELCSFGLFPGLPSSDVFKEEIKKYESFLKDTKNIQLSFKMDKLRTHHSHSEKIILINIYKNIDSLFKELLPSVNFKLKYFIVNIATYRDMCFGCQELEVDQKPLNKLLLGIKEKIVKNIPEDSSVQLKIISSGINAFSDQERPEFTDCREPINLDHFQGVVLHMVQNPIFTCGFDKNSKTYLSMKKNYFKSW